MFSQRLVMEEYDIGIMRTYIIPPTVVTTIKFLNKKLLKCLRLIKDVEIGILIPAALPIVITEVIIVVILVDMHLGLKISATIPL